MSGNQSALQVVLAYNIISLLVKYEQADFKIWIVQGKFLSVVLRHTLNSGFRYSGFGKEVLNKFTSRKHTQGMTVLIWDSSFSDSRFSVCYL